MTKELLFMRLEVTKMRKKFYKNKSETNEQSFKKISKQYRNEIKSAKIKFYADKLKKAGKDCTRFLGIWIDDQLNFQKQYEVLHNKLNDTLKALRAVRSLLNYKSKLLIYHSLIQSHVNYCTIAYFDKFNKS